MALRLRIRVVTEQAGVDDDGAPVERDLLAEGRVLIEAEVFDSGSPSMVRYAFTHSTPADVDRDELRQRLLTIARRWKAGQANIGALRELESGSVAL